MRIGAGLGNRLFQYASVKGFASHYSKEVNVEIENTDNGNHNYNWFYDKILNDIKRKIPTNSDRFVYVQPYDQHVGCVTPIDVFIGAEDKDIVLNGYFQHEGNFIHIKEEIKELLKESSNIAEQLMAYEKVLPCKYDELTIIHIRLGDYVRNTKHFVNLENYYKKCITMLRANSAKLNILIVCEQPDDIPYVYPSLLSFIEKDDVYINGRNTVDFDLYLMTRCKNIICSNSTYAWWGAWLNSCQDKRVFIPNKWLNDRTNILDMQGSVIVDT